jgi:hypothetical protein
MELVEDCTGSDKAFTNKKISKVLAIWFISPDLTWRLAMMEKSNATLVKNEKVLRSNSVLLEEMQSLMG